MQRIDDSSSTNITFDHSFKCQNDENRKKHHKNEISKAKSKPINLNGDERNSSLYCFTFDDTSGEIDGPAQEIEQKKKDQNQNETLSLEDDDDSFNISETVFSSPRSTLSSTENLDNLSAELDEKDKKVGRKQAALLTLQMDRNFEGFEMQIEMLQNANGRLRAELENEKAENAHLRKTIGRKEGILEVQEEKLTTYETQISEMSKQLKMMRNEKHHTSGNNSMALHTAAQKNMLQENAIKLRSELEKAQSEIAKLRADAESRSVAYKKASENWSAKEETLKLEVGLKEKEIAEGNGRNTKQKKALMKIYNRQKEVLKKFRLIKQKYSELKEKYREVMEQLRKEKEKRLNSYSIEFMSTKALDRTRSPSHSMRSLRLDTASKRRMEQNTPEVIWIDGSEDSSNTYRSPVPSTSKSSSTKLKVLKTEKKSFHGTEMKKKKLIVGLPSTDCIEEACIEMD